MYMRENIGVAQPKTGFAGVDPRAHAQSKTLAGGQGVLPQFALLSRETGDTYMLMGSGAGPANAVLCDATDTGEMIDDGDGGLEAPDGVHGIVWVTGHFITQELAVAEGYEITEVDREALRVAGILLSDACPAN